MKIFIYVLLFFVLLSCAPAPQMTKYEQIENEIISRQASLQALLTFPYFNKEEIKGEIKGLDEALEIINRIEGEENE